MLVRIALSAALLCVGCDGTTGVLVAAMHVSFEEQFVSACPADSSCPQHVEQFSDQCFDENLAKRAIAADKPQKKDVNVSHIRAYQTCLASLSGVDYWKDQDMAQYILSQVQ